MSGVAAQQKLSLKRRIKSAREQHVSAAGEVLAPEDASTVAKHRRTDLRVQRVNAILAVVFHLMAKTKAYNTCIAPQVT